MAPPTLVADIFDIIVDHLCDDRKTLKACCFVGVPRARKHLFACVIFDLDRHLIKSWIVTYPDTSNSPACYVPTLHFLDYVSIVAACENLPTWLHRFCHVKAFAMGDLGPTANPIRVSFVQLHGFHPPSTTSTYFFYQHRFQKSSTLSAPFPFSRFLFCKALPPIDLTETYWVPSRARPYPLRHTWIVRIPKLSPFHQDRGFVPS